MQPFSKNIVFFDTEFTNLDIKVGELLSIGLIKYTGEELYLEIETNGGEVDPWVQKKVLPYLTQRKVTKKEAQNTIDDFIGDAKPYLMAYVNQFDAMYWYGLFEDPKDHPAFWIPIDFASLLFAYGYDPESMRQDKFLEQLGIDRTKYTQHNALEDAKLLAETYKKFITQLL